MGTTYKCPVCGKQNPYKSFSECGIGTVERHYYCPECSYFEEQAYSPVYSGICEGFPKKYEEKIRALGIRVVPPEEVP